MPIKTGSYFIVNVYAKNYAFLPNPNSDEPIESRYKQNDTGEQWEVINRKNGHHGIRNIRHRQYAASGTRSLAQEHVAGWEREQPWLLQKTEVKGQYTIATTDSKRFWGLPDSQEGTPIALADVYTNRRNWWMFKDTETGNDAEIDPELDNGRTASDTADNDMVLQSVFFELVRPPIDPPESLELHLVVIQEMPNKLVDNATETVDKICRPLLKSRQLSPDNLRIKIVEFESFEDTSRFRFSTTQSFDELRDYRGADHLWKASGPGPVILPSLARGIAKFRSTSATKVVVLNLRSIPMQNGSVALYQLIDLMMMWEVIVILTLSEPHVSDTLFDTDLFRELARRSTGTILSLPAAEGRFYPCIVNYLQHFDIDLIKTKFPDVTTIKPEIPLALRKHLTPAAFLNNGYADDSDDDLSVEVSHLLINGDLLDSGDDSEDNGDEDDECDPGDVEDD
ncbi:hypothetical protein GALMADRAFT_147604 [Galerina marginata CBS 339.88]|uniref:Uncharacterized protein n=1 Tax=Galerina marginata (strain CBS 339.88) TaxID=685588 RepID=A0A067S779_GALM3|nr:hypothetical protein GALMADRAFT_147604 [Galerina marginata CBS 339.88]